MRSGEKARSRGGSNGKTDIKINKHAGVLVLPHLDLDHVDTSPSL